MFSAILLKKALPFVVTFFFGATAAGLFSGFGTFNIIPVSEPGLTSRSEPATWSRSEKCRKKRGHHAAYDVDQAVQIVSKPTPRYTEAARAKNIEGRVVLRVTFFSNGTVGPISVVEGLPYGLTESAIEAAREITFEPQLADGHAVTNTSTVEYRFSID
jgi:TonB family protein